MTSFTITDWMVISFYILLYGLYCNNIRELYRAAKLNDNAIALPGDEFRYHSDFIDLMAKYYSKQTGRTIIVGAIFTGIALSNRNSIIDTSVLVITTIMMIRSTDITIDKILNDRLEFLQLKASIEAFILKLKSQRRK